MLFNTNYYLVKKVSDINSNLINLIQTSGLKFILFENCLDGAIKFHDNKKIFNELIANKIKIIFLEKEKDLLENFFENQNNAVIFEPPKLSYDRDLIPDLSNALLTVEGLSELGGRAVGAWPFELSTCSDTFFNSENYTY